MVGRRININTTIQIYTYLNGAILRLNPFVDRRTRSHRSWQEGFALRLRDRLYDRRRQSEAASEAAQTSKATNPNAQRGNGTDIVLSDIYSSENDLNRDLRFGLPPGQTARERAEREARYAKERAEREANPPPTPEPIKETEAQRRRREAKEQAAYTRSWKQYQKRQEREAAKCDAAAFNMGHNAGGRISLDQQISQTPMTVAIA